VNAEVPGLLSSENPILGTGGGLADETVEQRFERYHRSIIHGAMHPFLAQGGQWPKHKMEWRERIKARMLLSRGLKIRGSLRSCYTVMGT
jgi:hypothetical protein